MEALDIEQPAALTAYLRQQGLIAPDEAPTIRVLAGGVSNRTVLVQRPSGEAWVVKQALAKLRVAVDWWSSPERIQREAQGMRHLATLAPEGTIVPLLFEDPVHHLLGMAAVPQPHANWKEVLLGGTVDPGHVRAFGALLGAIHGGATDPALTQIFGDRSFFESLRLEPYYGFAASRLPAAAAFLGALVDETRATRETLVHGDYSPKNVLVRPEGLVLLDHEVIHFGDGAFDVGFALAHLLSKANHLPAVRDALAQGADLFWSAYAQAAAPPPERQARAVRHALGCLLARVDGRSPLEYLDAGQRDRQRAAALALVSEPPATVRRLIDGFVERL